MQFCFLLSKVGYVCFRSHIFEGQKALLGSLPKCRIIRDIFARDREFFHQIFRSAIGRANADDDTVIEFLKMPERREGSGNVPPPCDRENAVKIPARMRF